MKKNSFFSKFRRSDATNGARPSRLRLETLEERQLLSVTDVAALIMADAVDDAQYVAATNVSDSVIDVGSVLNTMAGDVITQEDLLKGARQVTPTHGSQEEFAYNNVDSGFSCTFAKKTEDGVTNIIKMWVNSAPESKSLVFGNDLTALNELDATNLGLTTLDVSNLSSLTTLLCSNNQLSELDLASNTDLTSVVCQGNNLESLDLSASRSLSAVSLNYDVERLFVCRGKGVTITLANLPSDEQLTVKDSIRTEIEPTPETTQASDKAYKLYFNGGVSNPKLYDSVHVVTKKTGQPDKPGELKMTINPLFKLHEDSGSVYAVIDDDTPLTQLDLFKAVPANVNISSNYYNSDPVVVGDFSVSIVDANSKPVTNIKNTAVNPPIPIIDVQNVGAAPYLFYNGSLAPGEYTVSVTATKRGGTNFKATESFDYALTVRAAKIDAPVVSVTNRGIDTITATWTPATCTIGEGDNQTTVNISDVEYAIKVNGQTYATTANNSIALTGLNPDASYNIEVVASHYLAPAANPRVKDMTDSDPGLIEAFTTGSSIVVTLEGEDSNSSNDFDKGGAPNQISLREAHGYINRYYNGTAWSDPVAESDITYDETIGLYTYTTNDTTYAVVKTIRFADNLSKVYIEDSPIVSNKTFSIDGKVGAESIQINGVNPNPTLGENQTLDEYVAKRSTRIFEINAGTVTANDVVLTKGYADYGGALYISGGEYVANGGWFLNNAATLYGGAVYVGVNGKLTANDATFEDNESTRGGAIANFGEVAITGTSFFKNNMATPLKANPTNGSFGGAIYNAGTITIGVEDFSDPDNPEATAPKTTFNGNRADDDAPIAPDGIVKGYSGGAIYNTTKEIAVGEETTTVVGTVTAYNVDFTENFAGKYGGAVSNFGKFYATDATFSDNIASVGGAVQTSGTEAIFTRSSFVGNYALKSINAIADDTTYATDFGGNGGAVFASSGNVTFKDATSFTGNQAANAGGAIDYISGSLKFDKGAFTATDETPYCVTVQNNAAGAIGGAIVVAGAIDFVGFDATESGDDSDAGDTQETTAEKYFDIQSNSFGAISQATDNFHRNESITGGFYAPNVAITDEVSDAEISEIAGKFFAGEEVVGQDKLALFVRYTTKTTFSELTFDDLAAGIGGNVDELYIKVEGRDADYELRDSSWSTTLTLDSDHATSGMLFVVRYYMPNEPDFVYRTNVYALPNATSVVMSQIDMTGLKPFDETQIPVGVSIRPIPVGVSIRVLSANPVGTWTVGWGDGSSDTYDNYGFTCNVFHPYNVKGSYDLTIKMDDGDEYGLGKVSAIIPTQEEGDAGSGAVLDVNVFSDVDFVDELFEI